MKKKEKGRRGEAGLDDGARRQAPAKDNTTNTEDRRLANP
jgi:hypothetical protein